MPIQQSRLGRKSGGTFEAGWGDKSNENACALTTLTPPFVFVIPLSIPGGRKYQSGISIPAKRHAAHFAD